MFSGGTLVGPEVTALVEQYLRDQDFADNIGRAVVQDLRKFTAWFAAVNKRRYRGI